MFDNKLTIEDRGFIEPYLNGFEHETSGLTFSSLYMWRNINNFCWQKIGEYLCISGISHLEMEKGIKLPFMHIPLAADGKYNPKTLRETILEAREIFESKGQPFSIRLVPSHMMDFLSQAFPEGLEVTDDRENYDYVYRKDDLIELKGRNYHAKKNHLNYFKANNEYTYEVMTPEHTDEAMAFIRAFDEHKDIPASEMQFLEMEERAMTDALRNVGDLYRGGIVRIDGKIEALYLWGRLGAYTAVEHVEKANAQYRGLYQLINNEFCRNLPEHIKFVNREEDMGLQNLRKAKLSLKPSKLVQKFIVTIK